jgi:hypothetical protein
MIRERQLRLFGSKRQRGKVVDYSPSEFQLQCALADTLRRWIAPDWLFNHIPLGEHRTKATAARLQRMGVTAGWPDFILLSPAGRPHFLELKRRNAAPSAEQRLFAEWCTAHGVAYGIARNFDTALDFLKAWGAVRTAIKVSA